MSKSLKPASQPKERVLGLDLVRVLALVFVFTVHAVSYTGVVDWSFGFPMWPVYVTLRFAAMTSVPLFLLLSGYLCCEKKLNRSSFGSILPILLSYLCVSVVITVGCTITGINTYTLWGAINGIFQYTLGYGWYVEMYIGLFLLMPFFNIMFDALPGERARRALILILAALTILPPTLETFQVAGAGLNLTPDYWRAAYPLTYYFIGAYIRKHPPKLSRRARIVLAVIATALPCVICSIYSYIDGRFAWYVMNGFSAGTAALSSVAYFLLLYDLPVRNKVVRGVVSGVAICSFEMYLFSFVTDQVVWRLLDNLKITRNSLRFVLLIALTGIGSYILAWLLRLIVVPLGKWLRKKLKL